MYLDFDRWEKELTHYSEPQIILHESANFNEKTRVENQLWGKGEFCGKKLEHVSFLLANLKSLLLADTAGRVE